jgi:hypothetical protein
MPEYTFILFRPRESHRDFTMSCKEYNASITYRPGYENGYAILSQALRNIGAEDGPVNIIENRTGGLRQRLDSLYILSEMQVFYGRLTPPEEEQAAEKPKLQPAQKVGNLTPGVYKALGILKVNPKAWDGMGGKLKGMLKAKDYVVVKNKTEATLSETGLSAYEAATSQAGGE